MNHGEGRVCPAGLDSAEIGPEQAAPFAPVVLRHATREPQFAATFAKGMLRGNSHPGTLEKAHQRMHTLIRTSGSRVTRQKFNARLAVMSAAAALVADLCAPATPRTPATTS